ncbi:nucleoside-diphosphate-sugar epimerase [Pseudomonas duriflava]|uniref:Nucleoside-diphosphate-sugar epimerase n=1 Tax=Pseudomonas duriflava TaxID=459528 RepID=A0A562QPA5_9PSED|nr:SDR family oxidoreductase [Pseudomonas duriflava]TWI58564.1 nucleoside-diphosphate-sugar epimerase [Pseudomonas duriflava]
MLKGTALIVGVTGISGYNLANVMIASGWTVYGLARNPTVQEGVIPVAADLLDEQSVVTALQGLPITHAFFCTWTRRNTEKENVEANGTMMRNLCKGLEGAPLKHLALVTGTKHYLGPFENYGQRSAETPFRESEPRLPGENFYYTLEDILFETAERRGFTWSVHRSHSMIGLARGSNAMNMGVTLAVYATICKETGRPFVFPGSKVQWDGLTDITDAALLARQMEWAALSPSGHNQALNTVNGDVFRWRWMWAQIADYFGLKPAPCPDQPLPLEEQMKDIGPVWEEIARRYELVESDVTKLVSWWHSDADLGREIECLNDMTKSRDLGFLGYQDSRASFIDVFNRLRAERYIP